MLEEKIDNLKSYTCVENTRFKNRISITFNIDANIDLYNVEIPSMLLQPFVENTFIHAFPPSITASTLRIGFKLLYNGVLQCEIVDNCIGSKKKNSKNYIPPKVLQ